MLTKTAITKPTSRLAGRLERAGMVLAVGQPDTLNGILTRPQTDGRAFLNSVQR